MDRLSRCMRPCSSPLSAHCFPRACRAYVGSDSQNISEVAFPHFSSQYFTVISGYTPSAPPGLPPGWSSPVRGAVNKHISSFLPWCLENSKVGWRSSDMLEVVCVCACRPPSSKSSPCSVEFLALTSRSHRCLAFLAHVLSLQSLPLELYIFNKSNSQVHAAFVLRAAPSNLVRLVEPFFGSESDLSTGLQVESDSFCQKVIGCRVAEGHFESKKIPVFGNVETFQITGLETDRIDGFVGGFPCQAGKRVWSQSVPCVL